MHGEPVADFKLPVQKPNESQEHQGGEHHGNVAAVVVAIHVEVVRRPRRRVVEARRLVVNHVAASRSVTYGRPQATVGHVAGERDGSRRGLHPRVQRREIAEVHERSDQEHAVQFAVPRGHRRRQHNGGGTRGDQRAGDVSRVPGRS